MPDRMQPHDELPLLPPKAVETGAVLRRAITASRALAALDAASQGLPDPSILINTIPLQEAQASSEIENIVTTSDALYRAAALDKEADDPATREALRYRTALSEASQAVRAEGFQVEILRRTCSLVLNEDASFRAAGDFVHLRDRRGRPVYTPPGNGLVIHNLLQNLESYVRTSAHDPLVKMAVAHYQFEAIHPFKDGNGRTGRIQNLMVLQDAGLLNMPILYLSKYIIERKDEYYQLLADVTFEAQWEPWILWMLEGVERTSQDTLERIHRVARLQRDTAAKIQDEAPQAYRHGILEVLFTQPYCKIAYLVERGIAKRQTASQYLQRLEDIGILVSEKHGREIIYLHPALLDAMK